MSSNSFIVQRSKHYQFLLARELSLIKREHSQNLVTHQKLENSIRRGNNQLLNNNRTKISMPFDDIYNEQTGSIDYHNQPNNQNSFIKRRQSTGGSSGSSNSSKNQSDRIDDFSDDTLSSFPPRRRQYCRKIQRLPPITIANTPNQQKRENKDHWITSSQQLNISKETINEPFTILNEEIEKSNLLELTPIERQVRSFLETLPTYKGVQDGFDCFASSSLYSIHGPICIR